MYGGGKGWGCPDGKGWGAPEGKGWGPSPGWYGEPWYGGGGCGPDYGKKGPSKGDMYARAGPYDGGAGKGGGRADMQDFEKNRLVERVKDIQRKGGKEQWERFVDALRTGNRDPTRHTVQTLMNFIEAFEHGEDPESLARRTLGDGRILRLRGVPFQSNCKEIAEFLDDYSVAESQVTLGIDAKGKRTGEAFVSFSTADLAARALEEKQKREIQGRYIELFRSTHQELQEAKRTGAAGTAASSTGDSAKDDLVAKVKYIQRSDADGKELWYKYVDVSKIGNRDPTRHSTDSLRAFLESYETGASPETVIKKNASKILRLRGVPFQSTIWDVATFLEAYDVADSQVSLGYGGDGRRNGEAYAEFASVDLAEQALNEKQKEEIHGRYIELFRSSEDERRAATSTSKTTGAQSTSPSDVEKEEVVARVKGVQRSSQDGKDAWEKFCDIMRTGNRDPIKHTMASLRSFLEAYERGEMPTEAPSSTVLRLRGVPFQSDILDVVQFMSEYDVDDSQVILGCNAEGKPTGEAFVIFPSAKIAEKALREKHKKEIRGRYIECFRSSTEEHEEAACLREGAMAVDSNRAQGFVSEVAEKEDLVGRVKTIQRSSRDGRDQWEKFCDIMRTGNRDPLRHSASSMRHFLECYQKGEMPDGPSSGDNCVLRLRGVPFQSDGSDVVEFLEDYEVDQSQVVLGFSPNGKPLGEAMVRFSSPELADRALEEMQKKEIKGRYIELFRSNQEEFDEATKAAQRGMALQGRGPMEGVDEKDVLINQVKTIQRGSQDGRDAWEKYCETLKTGAHDPSRHTADSMRNFVDAWERGEAPEKAAEKLSGDGKVIKLRGVPFQSGLADVVKFLEAYDVEPSEVAVGRGTDGRATGEAFVIFKNAALAEEAMEERMKKMIRGRWIELFRSSSEDWNQAVALGGQNDGTALGADCSFDDLVARVKQIQRSDSDGKEIWYAYCDTSGTGNRDPTRHTADSLRAYLEAYDKGEKPVAPKVGDGRVLRLRGVPFQSTVMDIVAFLLEYGLDKSCVTLTGGGGGRQSGEAYVVFRTPDDAEHALKAKNRAEIDGRYIELFRSSTEERDRVLSANRASHGSSGERGAAPMLPTNAPTVLLKGLPFSTKVTDILTFLSEYRVHYTQVAHPMSNGRSGGEAFIAFPNVDTAEAVYRDKQKSTMGSRYIDIFRTTFDKWLEAGGEPPRGGSSSSWGPQGSKGGCGCGDAGNFGKSWGSGMEKGGCWGCGGGGGGDWGWEGKGAAYGACGGYPKGDGMSNPYGKGPMGCGDGYGEWYGGCGKGYDGGKGWGKAGAGPCGDYGKGGYVNACYGKGADYCQGGGYGKGADPYGGKGW